MAKIKIIVKDDGVDLKVGKATVGDQITACCALLGSAINTTKLSENEQIELFAMAVSYFSEMLFGDKVDEKLREIFEKEEKQCPKDSQSKQVH